MRLLSNFQIPTSGRITLDEKTFLYTEKCGKMFSAVFYRILNITPTLQHGIFLFIVSSYRTLAAVLFTVVKIVQWSDADFAYLLRNHS